MSTDIEQELREVFREKADDAPTSTSDVGAGAPRRVLRRARLRQVRTIAGSAAIAFALVVGSVAGLEAVLRDAPERDVGTSQRRDVVEVTGTLGEVWRVRFTGAFADDSACIRVTVGHESHEYDEHEPLCPRPLATSLSGHEPSMHDWRAEGFHILAGSVPLQVVEIVLEADDDNAPTTIASCPLGPLGWTAPDRRVCAVALPTEWSGTVRYLDADGTVLFEEARGWGAPDAGPSNQYPSTNEDTFITARGSFLGAEWRLQVLYHLDGYRLTIDGRDVFEGTLSLDEPRSFPLFEGDRARYDAIVLVNTDTQIASVAIATEGTREGRWIPGSTTAGGQARLWVIEMPGAGTGTLQLDGEPAGRVSWP